MNDRSFKYVGKKMSDTAGKMKTKREKATEKRRRQIIEAAASCIIENGYHQSGMREIASRAKVSIGNLYNHFSSKADMLAEIASMERDELEPYLRMLAEPEAGPETLDGFVTSYARYLSDPETVILTLEITCEAIRSPEIAALFLETRDELITTLADHAKRGIDNGSFRQIEDPHEAAHLLLGMIESCAYRAALEEVRIEKVLGTLSTFTRTALAP